MLLKNSTCPISPGDKSPGYSQQPRWGWMGGRAVPASGWAPDADTAGKNDIRAFINSVLTGQAIITRRAPALRASQREAARVAGEFIPRR